MRSRHKHRHQHLHGRQQFDLFRGIATARRRGPDWDALPAQTRQALTDLMARLILDHKENACHPLPREMRRDV
jgi:acyl-CoA reductase-like NAD-dependent aldehyde dehydrogenase